MNHQTLKFLFSSTFFLNEASRFLRCLVRSHITSFYIDCTSNEFESIFLLCDACYRNVSFKLCSLINHIKFTQRLWCGPPTQANPTKPNWCHIKKHPFSIHSFDMFICPEIECFSFNPSISIKNAEITFDCLLSVHLHNAFNQSYADVHCMRLSYWKRIYHTTMWANRQRKLVFCVYIDVCLLNECYSRARFDDKWLLWYGWMLIQVGDMHLSHRRDKQPEWIEASVKNCNKWHKHTQHTHSVLFIGLHIELVMLNTLLMENCVYSIYSQ